MSRTISFRDLRLIDALKKYNEIELLHPDRDDEVNAFLKVLGFNVNLGVLYVPSKHRDLQGNIGLGFSAVGEISAYSDYLNSPMCPLVERILAASKRDMSLAREMAAMLGSSVNIMAQTDDGFDDEGEEFPEEWIEPDYDEVSIQIKLLENLRETIRGSHLNDYGNLKTPEEYKSGN